MNSPELPGNSLPAMSRRAFARVTMAAAGAALLPATLAGAPATKTPHALRLGGPAFTQTEDPEELARWHRQEGYRAAYCPNVPTKEMNIHFREVRPGAGSLDYVTYLKRLARLPHEAPLMMEHLTGAEEYTLAKEHILDVGKKTGIAF